MKKNQSPGKTKHVILSNSTTINELDQGNDKQEKQPLFPAAKSEPEMVLRKNLTQGFDVLPQKAWSHLYRW